jgi:hypothetical protein
MGGFLSEGALFQNESWPNADLRPQAAQVTNVQMMWVTKALIVAR